MSNRQPAESRRAPGPTDLDAAHYTPEERDRAAGLLLVQRKEVLQELFREHELPVSGTKAELAARLRAALDARYVSYDAIVSLLDRVAPWGRQNVFLLNGPPVELVSWQDPAWLAARLAGTPAAALLGPAQRRLLPAAPTLTQIEHSADRLRITSVERHAEWERDDTRDQLQTTPEGDRVSLRAYVERVERGLVAFEWDLRANTAFVQVTQLPAHASADAAFDRFRRLVATWLPIDGFTPLDIRRSIRRLHEQEEGGDAEARSYTIAYATLGGRRFGGRSAGISGSVLGEQVSDDAMRRIRESGVGHLGNFYFLPRSGTPLAEELHVSLVGTGGRVSITAAHPEEAIRHVLARIRAHCA